jgi:hypothetical protein
MFLAWVISKLKIRNPAEQVTYLQQKFIAGIDDW